MTNNKHIFVFGTVDGDVEKLTTILTSIKVAEFDGPKLKWITGCDATVVQTGDLIGHKDSSYECFSIMQRLQEQAKLSGGNVVQIVGDQELQYVSPLKNSTFSKRLLRALRDKLLQSIGNGNHVAAYALSDSTIVTHAGALTELSGRIKNPKTHQHIFNHAFIAGIKKNDFSSPIFKRPSIIDDDDYTGLFETEYDRLTSDSSINIFHIVGHEPRAKIEKYGKIINVSCKDRIGVLVYKDGRARPYYFKRKKNERKKS